MPDIPKPVRHSSCIQVLNSRKVGLKIFALNGSSTIDKHPVVTILVQLILKNKRLSGESKK